VAGRRRPPANAPGAHFLPAWLAAEIVRGAQIRPDHLVFDLGAGLGALTAPLAASGARVVAVEINRGYAESLARRFASHPNVSVVTGDLRTVPLPGRDFRVVANLPFATTTDLLRRLLDAPAPRLVRADLVVERGFALRAIRSVSRQRLRWNRCYEIRFVRSVPARYFHPPPAVDAALLVIERVMK
jgi:23S rRNA (adenine-N6)-dimethyltransferase